MNRRDFLKLSAAMASCPVLLNATPVVAKVEEKPLEFFSTGLPTLDALLGGGFRPGQICYVLGGKGSGKTAFCQNMANAHNISTDLSHPNKGDNDILMINQRGKGICFTNYMDSYPQGNNYKGRYEFTREMKEYAIQENLAIVWTLPSLRGKAGGTIEWSNSFICIPDYLISLTGRSIPYRFNGVRYCGSPTLKVLKNRYGPNNSCIKVDIKRHNNKQIMCEL